MEHLTRESFRTKVFDYEGKKQWEYAGERPCIIDFYADWCGPCRMVTPLLEELARDYSGKVDIYKINTDEEQELSALFGISSIPSILFVPRSGRPQMAVGALPKEALLKGIREILNVA